MNRKNVLIAKSKFWSKQHLEGRRIQKHGVVFGILNLKVLCRKEDCEIFPGTYSWFCLCAVGLCSFKLILGMSQIPSKYPQTQAGTQAQVNNGQEYLSSSMELPCSDNSRFRFTTSTCSLVVQLLGVHNGSGSQGRVDAITSNPVTFVAGASFLGVGMCFI